MLSFGLWSFLSGASHLCRGRWAESHYWSTWCSEATRLLEEEQEWEARFFTAAQPVAGAWWGSSNWINLLKPNLMSYRAILQKRKPRHDAVQSHRSSVVATEADFRIQFGSTTTVLISSPHAERGFGALGKEASTEVACTTQLYSWLQCLLA